MILLGDAFRSGGGATGALMRAQDWSASPLGPPSGWPQPLKTLVGVMLAANQPMFVAWGLGRTLLYNDAYAEILAGKHPDAMGRDFLEVWHEVRADLIPIVEQAYAGRPVHMDDIALVMRRRGYPEEAHFAFSYTPVRDETGAVAGFFCPCTETTGEVLAERRQAFRLALEERLRDIADPHEVMRVASEALARHLGAAQAAFIEFDEDGEHGTIIGLWGDGRMADLDGRRVRADDFGHHAAEQRAGLDVIVGDVTADKRFDDAARVAMAEIGSRAFVSTQLVRDGRLRATFYAAQPDARAWTEAEVALVREVADRSWATVERARAEAALRESEERLTQALAVARLGTFEWHLATGAVALDDRSRELWGFGAQEGATAEDVFDRIHPDDVPRVRSEADASGATLLRLEAEYRVCLPDGTQRTVVSLSDAIPGPDGSAERMVGVFADVTERVRAEAVVRDLNATLEGRVAETTAALRLYENIVQSDTSPICAFDTDFRLIAFNKAHSDEFFRIFGHWVRVGEVFPDLFPPDQAPIIRGFMARALAGEVFTVTEEFGDPDLSKPYWEVAYTPLRDDAGRIMGAFHHAQDITARLRAQAELAAAQEALRQSQKMDAMGQLTGGVAHDFNNLLTPIMGVLDRLLNRGIGDAREQRLMAGALESAERAKVLVQRLLAFARRQPLQLVPVDIGGLVEGMAGLIGSTLGPKISVRVEVAEALPPANADANQLEMALLNLAVNARDAMPEGGTLTIRAAREGVRGQNRAGLKLGHYIRLSVTDNGVGMDEATRERAVEPFFSTKGVGRGTGLGLSMVHGLAAQLGGGLVIDSKPGQGTNVGLWLPVSAAPLVETGAGRAAAPTVAARGRALLVDDEELVRMSTADMLADLGLDVTEAASAEDALHLLHEGAAVDLLVTDHLMPGMSGADLACAVKALRPDLPILIVSGYANVDGLAPDLPRLTKPFRVAELAEKVATLMPSATLLG